MGAEPDYYLNMICDSSTRWRRHAASSSILLAVAVAIFFASGIELPLIGGIQNPGYRPFLWIIPLFASFALVLVAIARGRLRHRLWRLSIVSACAAVLVFWLVRAVRVAGSGFSPTFFASVFAIGVYLWLCWILSRRELPPPSTTRMLETIAIIHGIGPIAAVLLGSASLIDEIKIVVLALVPLLLVVLGFLIAIGYRIALLANIVIFAVLSCGWSVCLFNSICAVIVGRAFLQSLQINLVVSALFTLASVSFLVVNTTAWKKRQASS